MSELKILIYPYFEEFKTPVKENICDRVVHWVEKYKTSWENKSIEELQVGYQGMILECYDGRSVYVYDDLIVYSHGGITQWLTDPEKRINEILMRLAVKKYYKELNYFLGAKHYRETRSNKDSRKNNRIMKSILKLDL